MARATLIISVDIIAVMSGPDEASQGNSSGPNPKPKEAHPMLEANPIIPNGLMTVIRVQDLQMMHRNRIIDLSE
jgi:hypothetical protein